MRQIAVLPALLLALAPLLAQTRPREQELLAWHGNDLVRLGDVGRLFVESPGKGRPKEYELSSKLHAPHGGNDFFDGYLYACCREERDGKSVRVLYRSLNGAKRELDAWIRTDLPQGCVNQIWALPNDRYLLVSSIRSLFKVDKEFSFLAVGQKNAQGEVGFQKLIPVDLGKDAPLTCDAKNVDKDPYRLLYLAGFIGGRVRGEDCILFVNKAAGRILGLNTETLSTKFTPLFPEIPDNKYWSSDFIGFEYAILGIQPRRDGHFLLASRTQDAVIKAREAEAALGLDKIRAAHPDPVEARKSVSNELQNPRRKATLELSNEVGTVRFPEILWWDLNPKTGSLKKELTPHGAPVTISEPSKLRNFRFRFNVNEDMICFD